MSAIETKILLAVAALGVGLSARIASAQTEIAYRFSYAQPGGSTVAVVVDWSYPLAHDGVFVMPRAIPMGYGEQRYDDYLENVRGVMADGSSLPLAREEGPRWRVPAAAMRVTYQVDLGALERGVFAASDQSRVREGYLGALGYSVFGYLEGLEGRAVRLRVEAPPGWPVFSTLGPTWPVLAAPVEVGAPDFYALADAQIVLGPRASIRRLTDAPAPLYLVSYAEGPVDLDRVGRLAVTAYQRVNDYFGVTPFAHYTMHLELLEPISPQHEYGMSMEHLLSSTYYLAASSGLTAASPADDETRVLYNFAHHIAHAWLPKRVYGRGYFPFSWELAPVLDSIWFAEGFGQYAAIVAIAAAAEDPAAYREALITRRFRSSVESAPAFLRRMPLDELSRVAATRYAADFRTGRLVFSRGGLMAAAVDERIQQATGGARSLRDALRYLVAWAARELRGFEDAAELADLIEAATGVDTSAQITEWLRPLP